MVTGHKSLQKIEHATKVKHSGTYLGRGRIFATQFPISKFLFGMASVNFRQRCYYNALRPLFSFFWFMVLNVSLAMHCGSCFLRYSLKNSEAFPDRTWKPFPLALWITQAGFRFSSGRSSSSWCERDRSFHPPPLFLDESQRLGWVPICIQVLCPMCPSRPAKKNRP